ncbi:unnamed protein product [Absidia cylindrospora]
MNDTFSSTQATPIDTTNLARLNSPVLSDRKKNPKALSRTSTSSSFSISSVVSVSSASTPTTINTTSTLPLMMIRSPSRTLPLLMNDNNDDDDDDLDEHEIFDDLFTTSQQSLNANCQDDDDERQKYIHQRHWYRRVTKSLTYGCSHGDVSLVQQILTDERLRPFLNVNRSDDKQMGTTPLIYAACFGYISIVDLLLDAGAAVDGQDKSKSLLFSGERGWDNFYQPEGVDKKGVKFDPREGVVTVWTRTMRIVRDLNYEQYKFF